MKYTEGICQDGAAILCDGVQITVSEILERLNENERLHRGYGKDSLPRNCMCDFQIALITIGNQQTSQACTNAVSAAHSESISTCAG